MPKTNSYTHTVKVATGHLDDMHHVNNVVYLQWIQEIAEAHWRLKASKEDVENHAWVVSRHEIDYKRPAFLEDEIIVTTWVEKAEGVITLRKTEMHHKDTGAQLIQAQTKWCLVDPNTLRPKRLTETLRKLFL